MATQKAPTKKTLAKKNAAAKASAKKTVKSAKKTVAKTAEVAETRIERATTMLRKGVLAYVGLHGAAFDLAKFRAEQVREAANKARSQGEEFFGTLVVKGEEIEAKAGEFAKDAQKTATETFEETSEKVKSFVPSNILPLSANDRVAELQAEVTALNKKIAALSKKKTAPRKTVKMTTEKTVVTEAKTEETSSDKKVA
jgi:polyhydroxyalkanoate synthesis regulator phasin